MQLAATAGPAGKAAMYARAVQYGGRFLELHAAKDLDRARAELAVKKAEDEIAKLGGAASDKGRWMDVLKLVDPARDTIRGRWEQTKAGLLTDAVGPHAVIEIPIDPSGNYELEVKFVRLAGSEDVGVTFPVGPNHAGLGLAWYKGTITGLVEINGKGARDNETCVNPGGLSNNCVYTVVVRVMTAEDKAQITATLDGKPLVKWAGPQKALSVPFFVRLRNPKCVGLSAFSSRVLFQSVRLKMLSGEAVPTRPADAGSPGGRPPSPTSGGQATGEPSIGGWTVRDCGPPVKPSLMEEWGGRKNVLPTHPLNPDTACVLTKKIAAAAVLNPHSAPWHGPSRLPPFMPSPNCG